MKNITYSTADINPAERNIFADMLAYVSEYIYDISREKEALILEIEDDKEEEVLEKIALLRKTLDLDEIRQGREISTKVLKDFTRYEPNYTGPIFQELLDMGSIKKMTDGAYAYTGIFLDVYKYFSRKVEAFAKAQFPGIIEYEEASLYPIGEYERGHYFESFPHHSMFQTHFKSDQLLIERFAKEGAKNPEIFASENMRKPANVLRHAACVPIYPMLENELIPEDRPKYFLISGKCFRHEGPNVFELSRLTEFYMKEIVCVGTLDQALEMIGTLRGLWEELIETFGLKCTIETANDSFFASNYKKLKIFQILGDSKQELKIYIPSQDGYCAASSSNVHRTHFTKTYNIHNDHALCQSACFAFGIERMTYTFLAQKGPDPEKWDERTRQEVFPK